MFGSPENGTPWVTEEQDAWGRRRTGHFGSRVGRWRSLAGLRERDVTEGERDTMERERERRDGG